MKASIKEDFPVQIRVIENTFIPMSDAVRLAAKIWLPVDAEQHPVPAILEYLPYRKDDDMAVRDSMNHPYLAGHGYACLRVDMRGSGDSDGILVDEYTQQEHDDAINILQWLEHQPWCNGKVGMVGISWGGFNSLQVAALQPKQLKAIMAIGFTDDRYATDVHYKGGSLLAVDMLPWASLMLAFQALPPDPRFRSDWREVWKERLEKNPAFIQAWLNHQTRDAFWKHGSICEDFSKIQIPVYAISGWADSYSDSVLRTLQQLSCPKKALIGPWGHGFPQNTTPGPQIGFLQEALRWWDYWLKDIDTSIMDEPMLQVWMQDSVKPSTYHSKRSGRWIAEKEWISPNIKPQRFYLAPTHTLTNNPSSDSGHITIHSVQHHGLEAGLWCPYGMPGDFPPDQQREDSLCVCFDAETVFETQEILGYPELTLELSSDQPLAQIAARLCDISPTGESLLVSRGNLNLTHRNSHECPEALKPHRNYTITFPLTSIAHLLKAGHHWRLALSPCYWHHLWPSPKPVTLTITLNQNSFLTLPIRKVEQEPPVTLFQEPEISKPLESLELRKDQRELTLEHDVVRQTHTLTDYQDGGRDLLVHSKTELETRMKNQYTISENNPLSAKVISEYWLEYKRDDWDIRIHSHSAMTCNKTHFFVRNKVSAYEGEKLVSDRKTWFEVARDV
jgi:putative CocE/NonD family hydrolase